LPPPGAGYLFTQRLHADARRAGLGALRACVSAAGRFRRTSVAVPGGGDRVVERPWPQPGPTATVILDDGLESGNVSRWAQVPANERNKPRRSSGASAPLRWRHTLLLYARGAPGPLMASCVLATWRQKPPLPVWTSRGVQRTDYRCPLHERDGGVVW